MFATSKVTYRVLLAIYDSSWFAITKPELFCFDDSECEFTFANSTRSTLLITLAERLRFWSRDRCGITEQIYCECSVEHSSKYELTSGCKTIGIGSTTYGIT